MRGEWLCANRKRRSESQLQSVTASPEGLCVVTGKACAADKAGGGKLCRGSCGKEIRTAPCQSLPHGDHFVG